MVDPVRSLVELAGRQPLKRLSRFSDHMTKKPLPEKICHKRPFYVQVERLDNVIYCSSMSGWKISQAFIDPSSQSTCS